MVHCPASLGEPIVNRVSLARRFRHEASKPSRVRDPVFSLPNSAWQTISADMEFSQVTAIAKANIYFDGKVVSHTVLFPDGSRKTLGLISPGSYHFGTEAAERMEITDGSCEVVLDGEEKSARYKAGEHFDVAAKSGFTITADGAICQYVCSFLG